MSSIHNYDLVIHTDVDKFVNFCPKKMEAVGHLNCVLIVQILQANNDTSGWILETKKTCSKTVTVCTVFYVAYRAKDRVGFNERSYQQKILNH